MNPAERLLNMHTKLAVSRVDSSMVKVWAEVFELYTEGPVLEDEVTDCLMALRGQIDFTKGLLVEKYGVSPELLEPGFHRLRATASPSAMNQSWSSLRGGIEDSGCRHAFAWAAWVLRDEDEEEISSDDLQSLRNEIGALEDALKGAEMSQYLRAFIQKQVNLIRDALREYRVRGAQPVKDALNAIAGAYTVDGGKLQREVAAAPAEAKGVVARATAFIKRTAEVCDDLDKIKKATENVASIAAAVAPVLLPYLS